MMMTENEFKQFNRGFRIGIGIMFAFVIPAIIIGLKPEWNEKLIFGIFVLSTILWLAYKDSQEEEEKPKLNF